ncbi:DUF58 domain-containing protein [Vibrio sp. WXL210]|uniref:DUF58 domain-containing protein n=1 Tax=Vibrio sp. WXL210 TaxID=3450709 RepID=UPI003EC937C3
MILPRHSDGQALSLAELLYYQRHSQRWLPPSRSIWSYLSGQNDSVTKGRGMDFSEVRPYQNGDDVRSIDWRITARVGKPHTKLYVEERECPVMLAVDLTSSMQWGTKLLFKSVQAGHLASLVAWLAVAQKDRVGAVVIGDQRVEDCMPTARQQGPLQVINALRHTQLDAQSQAQQVSPQSGQRRFRQAMKQLHRLCPKGSDVVIISDFNNLDADAERSLEQLAQHNRLRLVHIYDPLELGQTQFRGNAWLGDRLRALQLNFSSKHTRAHLSDDFAQHRARLKRLSNRWQAPIYEVTAAQPLLSQLGG